MNLQSHLDSLNAKHSAIDTVIEQEEHRPNPDALRLMQLKRKKLRLKEEMSRLRS